MSPTEETQAASGPVQGVGSGGASDEYRCPVGVVVVKVCRLPGTGSADQSEPCFA